MAKLIFALTWLFLSIASCFLIVRAKITDENCYIKNDQTNEYWKLVWQDEFDEDRLDEDWSIGEGNCPVENSTSSSIGCPLGRNIYLNNGYLVLSAKSEKYLMTNYTVADIRTKSFHTFGRWEIRAAMPIDPHIKVLIFARNNSESYWHEGGQISFIYEYEHFLLRAVYFANSNSLNDNVNESQSTMSLKKNLHTFHRYGFEWTESGAKFFLDNIYGRDMQFDALTQKVSPFFQIKLRVKVNSKILKSNSTIEWKCPALIVDYVRVYEKMDNPKLNSQNSSKIIRKCTEKLQESEQLKIEHICQIALFGENKLLNVIDKLWVPLLLASLCSVSFGLIVYIRFQKIEIKKGRQELEVYETQSYSKRRHPYEAIKYDDQNSLPTDKRPSYLDLHDKFPPPVNNNSYLELQDKLPSSSSKELSKSDQNSNNGAEFRGYLKMSKDPNEKKFAYQHSTNKYSTIFECDKKQLNDLNEAEYIELQDVDTKDKTN